MALRYLVGCIVFTLLAFKVDFLSWLSAWIAFSLLVLATVYALAYNPIIEKKQGRIRWFYWFVFWPYLVINRLVWRIWKSKVPMMVAIDEGVWIGRSLIVNDHAKIAEQHIKTVIDLAPEINDYPPMNCHYIYQPLLDLAIPDPQQLEAICQQVNRAKQKGNVYIHCKFGLSRSVLVACAWLMRQGYTQAEAWSIVSAVQPKRVERPYMHIALALFAKNTNEQ
jgi:hypothetical protein